MSELAKELGLLEALAIGVGTMIGAGIFVLPGPATAVAGPAVALSFVAGGVISLFTACRPASWARRCRRPAAATTT